MIFFSITISTTGKILRYVGNTPFVFFFKFKNVQRDKYLNAQIPIVDKMFRRWIKQAY